MEARRQHGAGAGLLPGAGGLHRAARRTGPGRCRARSRSRDRPVKSRCTSVVKPGLGRPAYKTGCRVRNRHEHGQGSRSRAEVSTSTSDRPTPPHRRVGSVGCRKWKKETRNLRRTHLEDTLSGHTQLLAGRLRSRHRGHQEEEPKLRSPARFSEAGSVRERQDPDPSRVEDGRPGGTACRGRFPQRAGAERPGEAGVRACPTILFPRPFPTRPVFPL